MLSALLAIIVVALIVGVLLWGLEKAPWVSADIKQFIRVVIIVVFAIWMILRVSGMFGIQTPAGLH